jgi:hypothetical protein
MEEERKMGMRMRTVEEETGKLLQGVVGSPASVQSRSERGIRGQGRHIHTQKKEQGEREGTGEEYIVFPLSSLLQNV